MQSKWTWLPTIVMLVKLFFIPFIFGALTLSTGCASLTGSPMDSVLIDSEPQNVRFTVVNEQGEAVATGTTPGSVTLRTSIAPFKRARYVVHFDRVNYVSQSDALIGKFSPWYFLNYFLGYHGVLGFLIIDPFTGAMFRMPDQTSVVLEASQ